MIKNILNKLSKKQNLTIDEAKSVIDIIAEEKASPQELAEFLTLLKAKGETIEEITGLAQRIRELAVKINTTDFESIVDSCGTGGDCSNTFNISTASAILTASGGVNIAKHSNIGFTSKSGSSNVLQALNINLIQTPEEAISQLKTHYITFLHAPYFHKATSYIAPVRKELGFRTVFNILGPLTNPTFPTGQILGVSDPKLCPIMIEALKNLGCKKAMVVNGTDPILDEITICGKTIIYKLENDIIEKFEVYPEDFRIKRAKITDLEGDTPEHNAEIIKNILKGNITDAKLDALTINAASILWAGNAATSLEEGLKLAYELVSSGKGYQKLNELTKN